MYVRPVGSTLDDAAASAHRVGRTNAAIRERYAPSDILAALRDPTDLRDGSSSDDSEGEWPDVHAKTAAPDIAAVASVSAAAAGAGAGASAAVHANARRRWRHVKTAVRASSLGRKSWRRATVRTKPLPLVCWLVSLLIVASDSYATLPSTPQTARNDALVAMLAACQADAMNPRAPVSASNCAHFRSPCPCCYLGLTLVLPSPFPGAAAPPARGWGVVRAT